jgi:hypothetical protein
MKRSMVQVVVGIGMAVMALSCAEQSSVTRPAGAEGTITGKGEVMASATEFEGTIGRIDAKNGLITVEHWPLTKTFKVPSDCVIDVLTNVNAVLTELKVENAVVVTYSEAGKELVASRIVCKGKAYDQERREKVERLDEMLNPSPNQ